MSRNASGTSIKRSRSDPALDDEPEMLSRNAAWLTEARGAWPMYLLMIVGFRFLVVFFFRVQPPLAWTLTCVVHAICTFMSFHWNKGLPYLDTSMQQGEVAGLTAWEQWSRYPSTFWARQFLTVIPVILYIIAVTINRNVDEGGNDTFLLFNTVATALVLIAKLDVMYKVRVFGINSD